MTCLYCDIITWLHFTAVCHYEDYIYFSAMQKKILGRLFSTMPLNSEKNSALFSLQIKLALTKHHYLVKYVLLFIKVPNSK